MEPTRDFRSFTWVLSLVLNFMGDVVNPFLPCNSYMTFPTGLPSTVNIHFTQGQINLIYKTKDNKSNA